MQTDPKIVGQVSGLPWTRPTAFDQLAPSYDATWTNSPEGRAQREIVWREIEAVFHAGDHILDLGCGTGEDAAHLTSRGIRVDAIDASAEMVRIANQRGIGAQVLSIEELDHLEGPYDGALSNFGAFNCVADLHQSGVQLARLIRPGGHLALCIMPRLCWPEVLRFNFRRWRREPVWRGMRVYYPTSRQLVRAFPTFHLMRRRAIAGGDHCLYIFRGT